MVTVKHEKTVDYIDYNDDARVCKKTANMVNLVERLTDIRINLVGLLSEILCLRLLSGRT